MEGDLVLGGEIVSGERGGLEQLKVDLGVLINLLLDGQRRQHLVALG
jgi:hypothetical protein